MGEVARDLVYLFGPADRSPMGFLHTVRIMHTMHTVCKKKVAKNISYA
jgi:hypothetical protein